MTTLNFYRTAFIAAAAAAAFGIPAAFAAGMSVGFSVQDTARAILLLYEFGLPSLCE